MMAVEPDRDALRLALDREGGRVARMVRGSASLDVPVPGLDWTAGQAAMHLNVIYRSFATVVRGEDFGTGLADVTAGGRTLPEVTAAANAFALSVFKPGPPDQAADDLAAGAAELLAALDAAQDLHAECPTPWYGPYATRPVGTLAALAVSETLVHGRDLALALGGDRRLDARSARAAAPVVMSEMMPPLFDPDRAGAFTGRFEIRIRGAQRFLLHIDGGQAWTTRTGGQRADCVVSFAPAAALLIGLGRLPVWRAVATGGARSFGRRPWLGLRLSTMFLTP
jgi:uncharacterized protein (TIGR03083 family)